MDTQIWYSVFCTIFGGLYGILHHLGEVRGIFLPQLAWSQTINSCWLQIRTLGMLRSRFHTFPSAFNVSLIPPAQKNDQKRSRKSFFRRFNKVWGTNFSILLWNCLKNCLFYLNDGSAEFNQVPEGEKNAVAKFVLVWNQVVNSFRSEDLISNR